jgi:CubicO group peptidase (beta-lactamase class C family)
MIGALVDRGLLRACAHTGSRHFRLAGAAQESNLPSVGLRRRIGLEDTPDSAGLGRSRRLRASARARHACDPGPHDSSCRGSLDRAVGSICLLYEVLLLALSSRLLCNARPLRLFKTAPVRPEVKLESALNSALRDVPARRHIQSILVRFRGELVVERYFRDRRPKDRSNLHSVTKSFVASLVGIAASEGKLELSTSIPELLDVVLEQPKRAITVEHLLTMTSGLDAETPYDIDEIADRGESWIKGPLAAPLRVEPGSAFVYNNGAVHVLGAVLARATGSSLRRYAADRLFSPLGIEDFRWPGDPEGHPLAYGHLELRPRDAMRLGELYLQRGRFEGRQILDPAFVDDATTPHSTGGPPEGTSYGYLWWITQDAGFDSYFAGGYAGQYVTVVPELELVVVTTGDAAVFSETSRNLRRLVAEVVIPALH